MRNVKKQRKEKVRRAATLPGTGQPPAAYHDATSPIVLATNGRGGRVLKKRKKKEKIHTRENVVEMLTLGREVLAVAVVATIGGLSVRGLRATWRTQTGRNCHFVARALKCEHTRGHRGTRRSGFHTHHSALQLTGPTVLSLVVSRT